VHGWKDIIAISLS